MGVGIVQETPMAAISVPQSGTKSSSSVLNRLAKGYSAVIVSSTAGSITITEQASIDGVNFYDVVDTQGNTSGTVCTALTVTTGTYIQFPPVMAPYIRFKVVEGGPGATVVTIILLFVESV
jgi:hypothetical protein